MRAILRRKRASDNRGLSILEILIAASIGGMAMTLVAGLCRPMLTAQNSEEASINEIRVMDSTLYRLQRDVRQSDPNGIFICTNESNGFTCNQASNYSQPTDAPYLAILTAQAGGTGPTRWDSNGRPSWSGFNVYWLTPDGSGTNTLYFGFGSAAINPCVGPAVLNADAAAAVSRAVALTAPQAVAQNVLRFQSMVDVTRDRVALRLVGATTSGSAANHMSVQGDAYARN